MRFLAGVDLCCYWIVRVTVVVCVRLPLIPVIVRVVGFVGLALGFALTVNVVAVVELVGLNEALVRGGKPLTENVTALLNPLIWLTEIK